MKEVKVRTGCLPNSLTTWAVAILLVIGVLPAVAQQDDPVIGDKPLSVLLKQLRSENRGLQVRAARILSDAPAELRSKIAPKVMPLLKSERENDRFVAAQFLGECGPVAGSAVPDLLPMLKGTQYERNRAAAAKALGQILKDSPPGEEIDKVTAKLIEVFEDGYEDVRREAVNSCGMIGPAAKSCIPHLAARLKEQSSYQPNPVAMAAAWTCERMGPLAKEHVDLLITLMHRVMGYTPAYVSALGGIGPLQKNIVPNILDNMEQYTSFGVEFWAVLEKFGPQADVAMPFTKKFLSLPWSSGRFEQQFRARIAALKFVQAVGPSGRTALPEVKELSQVPQQWIDGRASSWSLDAAVMKDLGERLRTEATKALVIFSGGAE